MTPTATAPARTANLGPFHQCATCGHDGWTAKKTSSTQPFTTSSSNSITAKHAALIDDVRDYTHALDADMRTLSLAIHGRPELGFQETFAADTLCDYMQRRPDWTVERGICGLDTAWSATWRSPYGAGRTVGFNSEMDALPGIGHACGHNLIAIAGVASALATARALQEHKHAGTVVLLGTPAEEGGGGKCIMLERGAYAGMDACMMTHPAPYSSVGSSLAVRRMDVTFRGKTAHAAATPWAGVNALDAAVVAYNAISALRQQTEDGIRIQGIILPQSTWAQNVIPDVARMTYGVRAPTWTQVERYFARVRDCFEGAAKATQCTLDIDEKPYGYQEILLNDALAGVYASVVHAHDGVQLATNLPFSASTDFGNVTQHLPGLHPVYAIPLADVQLDANHTVGFTNAAKTAQAHTATLQSASAIAATACVFSVDDAFADQVKREWHASKEKQQQ